MATVSELEAPAKIQVDSGVSAPSKTFRVPTAPVDGKGEVVAFIGPGVEFKGQIFYQGSVQIDGVMNGEIHTEGTLLVGEQAVINAKVTAGSVLIKGKMTGDVVAHQKVQLLSTAVMDGSLQTPQLSMDIGVVFNGDISMTSGGERSEERPSKVKSQLPPQKPNGNTSHNPSKKNKEPESVSDSDTNTVASSSTENVMSESSASNKSDTNGT